MQNIPTRFSSRRNMGFIRLQHEEVTYPVLDRNPIEHWSCDSELVVFQFLVRPAIAG